MKQLYVQDNTPVFVLFVVMYSKYTYVSFVMYTAHSIPSSNRRERWTEARASNNNRIPELGNLITKLCRPKHKALQSNIEEKGLHFVFGSFWCLSVPVLLDGDDGDFGNTKTESN